MLPKFSLTKCLPDKMSQTYVLTKRPSQDPDEMSARRIVFLTKRLLTELLHLSASPDPLLDQPLREGCPFFTDLTPPFREDCLCITVLTCVGGVGFNQSARVLPSAVGGGGGDPPYRLLGEWAGQHSASLEKIQLWMRTHTQGLTPYHHSDARLRQRRWQRRALIHPPLVVLHQIFCLNRGSLPGSKHNAGVPGFKWSGLTKAEETVHHLAD